MSQARVLWPRSHGVKPIVTASAVNWSHPLAWGLSMLVPYTEKTGVPASASSWTSRDLVNPGAGMAGNTSGAWTIGGDALGVYVADAQHHASVIGIPGTLTGSVMHPRWKPTTTLTFLWRGVLLANTGQTGTPEIAMVAYADPSNVSPYSGYGFTRKPATSQTCFTACWSDNGTFKEWDSAGGVLVYGRPTCLGQVISVATGMIPYKDGVAMAAPTAFTGPVNYGASSTMHLGNGGAQVCHMMALWNRVLSPVELQWLTVEPWALMEPSSPARTSVWLTPTVPTPGISRRTVGIARQTRQALGV